MKRNAGRHTSEHDARQNILKYLSQHFTDHNNLAGKSLLGFVAYPGYDFKRPQGAAFAVARIVRRLEDEGLVRYESRTYPVYERGHYITAKGVATVKDSL